tara:strand:+ start:11746 stop:11997 length:252 start_codon:yes stop_codon:yes gene_type:complete
MTQEIKRYGRTSEEKRIEKVMQCREIVSEILKFGVDEFQKAKIIQLISLEMESRDFMLKISESFNNFEEEIEESKNENKLLTV